MKIPLLINMKMPTIVGIFIFISREFFVLSRVEHEKSFITSGPDLTAWTFVVRPYCMQEIFKSGSLLLFLLLLLLCASLCVCVCVSQAKTSFKECNVFGDLLSTRFEFLKVSMVFLSTIHVIYNLCVV